MADEIYSTKRCSCCNGYLPLSSFYKHAGRPFDVSSRCKECAKRISREWLRDNPERAQATHADWYERNAGSVKARSRAAYRADPVGASDYARQYRAVNKDRKLANDARWQAENPDKVKKYRIVSEARRRSAFGSFTANDINKILTAQKFKCAICRVSVKKKRHIDHIMPLSLGGSNNPSNLQVLCPSCNCRKHAKDPIKYMQEIGRLI